MASNKICLYLLQQALNDLEISKLTKRESDLKEEMSALDSKLREDISNLETQCETLLNQIKKIEVIDRTIPISHNE